ncbi:helix-turn-helix domain-containing protein [Companilactobacillus mindensis]|uniref:helix-turn-helix domain-containing protein n=1 Tax=Companilactobacillus mindensis TaxID=167481 RepID=UPI00070D41A1|nr:helix-turn-helix transcriptional regulator [Companilactobacillus mindensis]GEO78609.1 hypothetical protein LMI01_09400 [Companilactobacillus mindensis]
MTISNYYLGQKISSIRLNLGLSQEQFAEKVGSLTGSNTISKGTVNNWEHGRNKPNKARQVAIAKLGGITRDELINDEYGWELWSKATGISEERIKQEYDRMYQAGRVKKEDDIQDIIGQAVANLSGDGQTDAGAINQIEYAILNLGSMVDNFYIDDEKKKKYADKYGLLSFANLDDIFYDDMNPDVYHEIFKILQNTRMQLDDLKEKYHLH